MVIKCLTLLGIEVLVIGSKWIEFRVLTADQNNPFSSQEMYLSAVGG